MFTHEQHEPAAKWVFDREFQDGDFTMDCRVYFGDTLVRIHPKDITRDGKSVVISFLTPYTGKVTFHERKSWRAGE